MGSKSNVRIDKELLRKIKKLSVDLGMFTYELVEIACEEYIKKVLKEA